MRAVLRWRGDAYSCKSINNVIAWLLFFLSIFCLIKYNKNPDTHYNAEMYLTWNLIFYISAKTQSSVHFMLHQGQKIKVAINALFRYFNIPKYIVDTNPKCFWAFSFSSPNISTPISKGTWSTDTTQTYGDNPIVNYQVLIFSI